MSLIFRSKTNQQVGGNLNVAVWRKFERQFPMFIRKGIEPFPTPNSFFGHTQIRRQPFTAPRPNNVSETIHETEYGKNYPFSQGNIYPYTSWINSSHCIS